jgi:hypothetical protein
MDQRAFLKSLNLGKEHTINGEYKYIFTKNPLKEQEHLYILCKNKRLLTMLLFLLYFISDGIPLFIQIIEKKYAAAICASGISYLDDSLSV